MADNESRCFLRDPESQMLLWKVVVKPNSLKCVCYVEQGEWPNARSPEGV